MRLGSLLALPGVVIHELGHYLFCRLCGAPVQEVVFFEASGPSGYVVHGIPKRLRQHAIIVFGPLVLNTSLAFLLFRAAVSNLGPAEADLARGLPIRALETILATGLGWSIGLQAIPSRADATSLWDVALDRLRAGNLFALLALPCAGLFLLINRLRRYWIDWLYALGLTLAAIWFPW